MPQQPGSLFDGSVTPSRRAQKFVNNDVVASPRRNSTARADVASSSLQKVSLDGNRMRPQKSVVLNRQTFVQPAQLAAEVAQPTLQHAKSKRTKRKKPSNMQIALSGMAGVVLVVGLSVSLLSFQTNKHIKAQVKAATTSATNAEEGTGDVPSESKPANVRAYQVAPNLPKYIKISRLGLFARIKSMGVNNKNELMAPSNIYDAGWFNSSAKPGDSDDKGAILIDGHVHGPTYPGVFNSIKKLKPGDEIQIQRGDNQTFKYSVVRVQNYDANTLDMRLAMASVIPGKPGLNLITCGGKYDRATGYNQRTLVFAVQKN